MLPKCKNAATIAPGMYKLDPVILAPKVKNNTKAHEYYLKHTMEQAAILRELIQELLGYVRDTFPDIHKPSEKLVAVTPINKNKTVRFADTTASSSNMPKVINRPLISSTGVKPSTSASGSKSLGNTKNNRISRTPSSYEKNKVEVQSRKAKSSLNKQNSDSKNVCNEHVKHPVKGAQALCSVCNECLFDGNHAMCLIDHVNSMNVLAKSASKKNKRRKEWKPTGKVLTATSKVSLRVLIPLKVVVPNQMVTRVYTRRPKVPKSVQHSKPKVAKSTTANRMEPGTSWGSDTSVAPSSSSFFDCSTVRFGNDQVEKIMRYGDYQIGNVIISRVYYVKGLGHNLFLVGQFCDSDLEVAFQKHTCFVRNMEGVDLLSGSRGTNPYSLSIGDMMASSPLTAMASEQSSLEPALHEMTLATPSSGLVPNPSPSTPFVYHRGMNGILCFNQCLMSSSPSASVASLVPVEEAAAPVKSTGSPSSTTVDQDAPSPSTSQTTSQSQSQTIPLYAEEEYHDLEVAHMSNDPYFGIPIPEIVYKESSSSDVISTTVHSDAPISKHLSKWTKDHPLQNIIGDPSRPVSIRLQLHEQAMFCYYNAFLTLVEPKTYKDALTQSC
ncbi:hypothetical protein Tco_0878280 [Tanacetum coccineum]|uniref:Integrase, catalytic region, zinc finger, CCHC-type, peptidase aspartic, catalytic n=1 Tax=Tanacetum coccineum TaxID=301880 RepID=A0ABQ5C2T2_9ASTR